MASLRRQLRNRSSDPGAVAEYRQARAIVGNEPASAQRFWLLSQALGWDEATVAKAVRREAAGFDTKPLVDRLLATAERWWGTGSNDSVSRVMTSVGDPRVARDSLEQVTAGNYVQPRSMNPADPGFRFVTLPGHAVAVRVREGDGPPLVFLPGGSMSGSAYERYFFDYLSAQHTVSPALLEKLGSRASAYLDKVEALGNRMAVMIDLPGRGHSDPFPDRDRPRTWFDYAEVVRAVLDRIEAHPPPIILAHSLGGPMALAYHARYGAAGLQLFDGSNISGVCNYSLSGFAQDLILNLGKQPQLDSEFGEPFLDTYLGREADATLLDLRRAGDELAAASYSPLPGVSFRKNPLTWWNVPSWQAIDWRYQGLAVANRLGMVCVTGGDHNPYWTVPELTRYALLELDEAVARGGGPVLLDPAMVHSLNGNIDNPEVMHHPRRAESVTLEGIPRFRDEIRLPLLPRRLTDRAELARLACMIQPGRMVVPEIAETWPHGSLGQPPVDHLRRMVNPTCFPGASEPVPREVFSRFGSLSSQAIDNIRAADGHPLTPAVRNGFGLGSSPGDGQVRRPQRCR